LLRKTISFCPYCKDTFSDPGKSVLCSVCKTLHHALCWKEHRQCSVFGCGGTETSVDEITISVFRKRKRLINVLSILPAFGVLLFFAGIVYLLSNSASTEGVANYANVALIILVVVPFALFIVFPRFIYRCPACNFRLSIGEHISLEPYESCPYCGVRFLKNRSGRKDSPIKSLK